MRLRAMGPRDWHEIAKLICVSTNYWYQCGGKPPIFTAGPESCLLFCQVLDDGRGGVLGFLCSVAHPASNMLGPGVMRNEADAAALILRELNHHRG